MAAESLEPDYNLIECDIALEHSTKCQCVFSRKEYLAVLTKLVEFIQGEDCFCFEQEDGNLCKRCEVLGIVKKEN